MRHRRQILGTDADGLLTLAAALLLAVVVLTGGAPASPASFAAGPEAASSAVGPELSSFAAREPHPPSPACTATRVDPGPGSLRGSRALEQELHAHVLGRGRDLGVEPGACEER